MVLVDLFSTKNFLSLLLHLIGSIHFQSFLHLRIRCDTLPACLLPSCASRLFCQLLSLYVRRLHYVKQWPLQNRWRGVMVKAEDVHSIEFGVV